MQNIHWTESVQMFNGSKYFCWLIHWLSWLVTYSISVFLLWSESALSSVDASPGPCTVSVNRVPQGTVLVTVFSCLPRQTKAFLELATSNCSSTWLTKVQTSSGICHSIKSLLDWDNHIGSVYPFQGAPQVANYLFIWFLWILCNEEAVQFLTLFSF